MQMACRQSINIAASTNIVDMPTLVQAPLKAKSRNDTDLLNQEVVSSMMTSPNWNIFRVTRPLWGESTDHRWIPLTIHRECFYFLRVMGNTDGLSPSHQSIAALNKYCWYVNIGSGAIRCQTTSWNDADLLNQEVVSSMMTSPKWNIFRVTGPLWGESTDHRWIPLTKASDAELWCFLWRKPEQTAEQTLQMLVIWDAMAFIMTSL